MREFIELSPTFWHLIKNNERNNRFPINFATAYVRKNPSSEYLRLIIKIKNIFIKIVL